MENKINKSEYSKPEIEVVKLDNEISLALESNPPNGPNESAMFDSNNPKNNPYKENLA